VPFCARKRHNPDLSVFDTNLNPWGSVRGPLSSVANGSANFLRQSKKFADVETGVAERQAWQPVLTPHHNVCFAERALRMPKPLASTPYHKERLAKDERKHARAMGVVCFIVCRLLLG